MNHFEILGVSQSSSLDEIKSAYRKLAMQFHPDRNPAGEERFKAVSASYAWIEKNHRPGVSSIHDDIHYKTTTSAPADRMAYDVIYRIIEGPPDENHIYHVKIPHTIIDIETRVFFMINYKRASIEFKVTLPAGTSIPYTIKTKDLPALGQITIQFSTGIDKY